MDRECNLGKFDKELCKRMIENSSEVCKTDTLIQYTINKINKHSDNEKSNKEE